MKKKILAVAALGILAAGTAHASGYRIPEQSINGVALSNAYIAHTEGPDTAYYNPANMGWQEDRWQMEVSASYINLPPYRLYRLPKQHPGWLIPDGKHCRPHVSRRIPGL